MKIKILFFFIFVSFSVFGQIDANSLMGLPTATNAEMVSLTGVSVGSLLFNTTDQEVYRFTSTGWQKQDGSQNASQVSIVTPVDVNNISGEPGAGNETTVEEVVQAIAPITSKAARVFYPPSIAISTANPTFSVNLYSQYTLQFATPTAKSTSAPAAIPTYAAGDLYYYVTYADPAVFSGLAITDAGMLTGNIIGQPTDLNSLINVVFVVK